MTSEPNVLRVEGDLDVYAAAAVEEQGAEALNRSPEEELVVDLAGVQFIDSAGLGALIELKRHANELGTTLALRSLTPSVRKVITVTGLVEVFGVEAAPLG